MSNPALNRMLRGGGLTNFHVGNAPSGRGDPHRLFAGEVVHSTFSATEYKKDMKDAKDHDFSKKEHREEKKKKKSDSDSESDGEGDDGPKTKKSKGDTSGKNGFPAKGSDGDGDGKKNEPKKKMDWQDKNSNGTPDGMEKKKT